MLCNCPYCATDFPDPCLNGFIFCSHCQRIVESDKKNQLQKLHQSSDKNIGYGETGLDFYYSAEEKKCQIDLFETLL